MSTSTVQYKNSEARVCTGRGPTSQLQRLKTEMLTQKVDLSRRLALIDLGDIKQSAFEEGYDKGVVGSSSKKRQRS